MVAFAMDCVFVLLASFAAAQTFFPDEMESGMQTSRRYVERLQDLEEGTKGEANATGTTSTAETLKLDQNQSLNESGDSNATKATAAQKKQSKEKAYRELQKNLQADPALMEMATVIVFSLFWVSFIYWFAGERFFGGSSLGKRMFSLATVDLRTGVPPLTRIALLRVFLKIIPFIFWPFIGGVAYPLLALSYLIAAFNQRFMAGHDYACRTMVIRGQFSLKEQEESTNATP